MVNRNKAKGDSFERTQRDHAIDKNVDCSRTKAGYERDAGDLHFYQRPGRPPLAVGQCKAVPSTRHMGEYLRDAEQQRLAAEARWGVAIIKRVGVGDPGLQYVAMTYDTYLDLLAAASFGRSAGASEQERSSA